MLALPIGAARAEAGGVFDVELLRPLELIEASWPSESEVR